MKKANWIEKIAYKRFINGKSKLVFTASVTDGKYASYKKGDIVEIQIDTCKVKAKLLKKEYVYDDIYMCRYIISNNIDHISFRKFIFLRRMIKKYNKLYNSK